MNLNWRWLCGALNSELAFTERLLPSLFPPFLSLLLSFEQQRRSYRRVLSGEGRRLRLWGESGSYHCLTLFLDMSVAFQHSHWDSNTRPNPVLIHFYTHTHTHTDIKDLRVVEHSRTLACRFTHTHVYIQRSAPEKLPSNPFTSLCRGLLLSGPPLRLCWW